MRIYSTKSLHFKRLIINNINNKSSFRRRLQRVVNIFRSISFNRKLITENWNVKGTGEVKQFMQIFTVPALTYNAEIYF